MLIVQLLLKAINDSMRKSTNQIIINNHNNHNNILNKVE